MIKEEVEKKKQKQTKKKQIKLFIQSSNSQEAQDIYEVLLAIIQQFDSSVDNLMGLLEERKYEQLVKSKKKEAKVELVKRDDFLEIVKLRTGLDLMAVGDGILVEILS